MKKIVFLAAVAAAVVAFVGVDVVRATVGRARGWVRESLTADVPLKAQLAEARTQIDAYAESVIRGEVAAENLAEMIGRVEREVRSLESRVERERGALTALRRDLEVVPTSTGPNPAERDAVTRARRFQSMTGLLERRRSDLERLRSEHASTERSLQEAKGEQVRLAEEIKILAAEIESLDARTAAARTRESVGDASVASSGFAQAAERLQEIRTRIKERNKLLEYYEVGRVSDEEPLLPVDDGPATAIEALDQALADSAR